MAFEPLGTSLEGLGVSQDLLGNWLRAAAARQQTRLSHRIRGIIIVTSIIVITIIFIIIVIIIIIIINMITIIIIVIVIITVVIIILPSNVL